MTSQSLSNAFSTSLQRGRKLIVPYLTGGLGSDWLDYISAACDAGVDAIEVGIPFSDPIMDGPTIQASSQLALENGATPLTILSQLSKVQFPIPIAVMTYYNIVHHAGEERFAGWLAESGVSAAIIPDLPMEESAGWRIAAGAVGVQSIQLIAPNTSDKRAAELCELSEGFIYAVGLLGVTGERLSLAESATLIAKRLKPMTSKAVLVGVGISSAEQARQATAVADGVIVGSAVVRRVLEGEGPVGVYEFLKSLRASVDAL